MTEYSGIFVHAQALVETDRVGDRTRIWAFAHVMKDATIGVGCNICDHCFVESGARLGDNVTVKNGVSIWNKVVIEDNVFLGPNMVFTNDPNPRAALKKKTDELLGTIVCRGATIGANATILCGITIGRHAFIGAGSVVTKDVPDHSLMIGVPARRKGWMCACGHKIRQSRGGWVCSCCRTQYRSGVSGLEALPHAALVKGASRGRPE